MELLQNFLFEDRDECIKQLVSDFPGILNRNYVDSMLTEICRQAGIERNHKIKFSNVFEGQLNSVAVIKNLLPSIYCICLTDAQGEDKWPALRRTFVILIEILRFLKGNTEVVLNRGFEEAINLTIHREGEFGIELPDVVTTLEKRFKIRLKRGPKPVMPEKSLKATYRSIMNLLEPGFKKNANKMEAVQNAVNWCNSQLDSASTMDFEPTVDTYWGWRSAKEIAIKLTSIVCQVSPSTVRRSCQ